MTIRTVARPVPFVDLAWQHARIADEVAAGTSRVLARASFVLGEEVAAFEAAYARYCGTRHAVGVGNGTDAVELALRGVGVRPGDEVVVPANTFVATAEGVLRAGARPVLVDVRDDFMIDPDRVAAALTSRTRAVAGVHLYGRLAPLAALRAAVGPDVRVVEDAAQSHGASVEGRRSGSLGDVAATSFYPGKNLGAYGDAGGVTTDDDEVAARVRGLRNHGGTQRYQHDVAGMNSRLDELQAVVLSAKLTRLDAWNALRREAASRYATLLGPCSGVVLPVADVPSAHVWHLYVVRVPDRDRVLEALQRAGVGAGVHYPAPLHLLPALADLGHGPGDFPVAEQHAREILSLPIFPGITAAQQERVVEVLAAAVGERAT